MAHLTLAFLGPPQVQHGERPLSFSTRKALALLIYLAVEGGMHPREKLAPLLWPESSHKAGRASLRTTLALLRKALAHPDDDQRPPHLHVTRNAIGFNPDADYKLDLTVVADVVDTRPHNSDTPLSNLQSAAALIRGEFLAGFSLPDAPQFDDWVTFQQEQWHLRCRRLFDRLTQQQMARGETAAAIATLNRWLAHNPLTEQATRRLMRAHVMLGDRPGALQVYEKCREVLAAEVGVEPAPETAALAEQIREGDQTTRWQSNKVTRSAPEHPVTPSSPHLVIPLTGRAEEHGQLVAAYHHARRGRFRTVIIQGEAGIGKTRLAHHFLNWATAQGATVLRGRAFESGGRLPYQPLVDALRPLWQQPGESTQNKTEQKTTTDHRQSSPFTPSPGHLVTLSPTWLAELSRLLPQLRDRYPDLPPPTADEAAARTRLFAAAAHLGQTLGTKAPLVLFVDDIQWTDAATRDLLQYVAHQWQEAAVPIMLLLGLRSEALARADSHQAAAPLREWLTGLRRSVDLTRIALSPLTAANTQQLVAALGVGADHVAPLARWLHAETGGQPFYLAETIKALVDKEKLVWIQEEAEQPRLAVAAATADDFQLPAKFMPPGVRDVILGRLARLSPAAFRLLAAGAVMGQAFGYRQLCRIAGVDVDDGLPALDRLLAANLLEEAERGKRPYLFAHDKIRDVVYTEAGDARRRLYHERAYEMLAADAAPAAQIAHHALAAGLVRPAFTHTITAGDEAMALFAVQDGVTHYEQARTLLRENPSLKETADTAQLHHLYNRLGRGYELLDAWETARQVEEEMLALAEEIDAPVMKVAALNRLAAVAIQSGADVETAADLLATAVTTAEACGDEAGLAEAEWNLAQTCYHRRDRAGAVRHGWRALKLAQSLDQPKLVARSHNIISYAQNGPAPLAQIKEAETHAAAGLDIYRRLGNRAMAVDCMNMLGSIELHRGQPAAAVAQLRQARQISREIDNVWGQANTGFNLAQALLECGRYGEALATAAASHQLAAASGSWLTVGTLTVRGNVYRALQAPEKALADHQEVAATFAAVPNPHVTHMMAANLCVDYAAAGDWAQAHRHALWALDRSRADAWLFSAFHEWRLIQALLRGGDAARARQAASNFGDLIGDNPRYLIPFLRAQALLARHDGELAAAAAHLETALAQAEALGLPGEQWSILAALAEVRESQGEEETAASLRARSREIIDSLAETIDDAALRAEFSSKTLYNGAP